MTVLSTRQKEEIIQNTVSEALQAAEIDRFANFYFYDLNGYFVSTTFQRFSQKVSEFSLELIKKRLQADNCYEQEELPRIEGIVIPLIDEKLKESYKVIPFYDSIMSTTTPPSSPWLWGGIVWVANLISSPLRNE